MSKKRDNECPRFRDQPRAYIHCEAKKKGNEYLNIFIEGSIGAVAFLMVLFILTGHL